MPRYDYQCGKCGHVHERIQHMNDEHVSTCPECGEYCGEQIYHPTPHKFDFPTAHKFYDHCLGETVYSKKHYEQLKREKGLVKVD